MPAARLFGATPSMERIRHPEILPLEVWDLMVAGALLGELTCSPGFPDALRTALELLHAGRAATRTHGLLPPVAAGFDAVLLTGGRSHERALRAALSNLAFPVYCGDEDLYAGAPGGFECLRARGFSGWVADLGQSHFKIASPHRRWVFARDWTRLRPKVEVLPSEEAAHRRRLREFVALRFQMAMAEAEARPPALVFALPTRVGEDGTPEGSSYAGMRGDRALLPEAMAMAGLAGRPLLVLNDAELAALSARLDARVAGLRKVLVLTLGFGIGAALIRRAYGTRASALRRGGA